MSLLEARLGLPNGQLCTNYYTRFVIRESNQLSEVHGIIHQARRELQLYLVYCCSLCNTEPLSLTSDSDGDADSELCVALCEVLQLIVLL